ncbi:MAG: alpha-hydroxy acid oxidase [Burkholderiaceae bacterium]|nr:alpha-hydroxy acid oxidase [Burkholderiaceae bacterium]
MKHRAIFSADQARLRARARLPRIVFDFVDGGATHERTLRDNEAAFARWQFMPRVAVDTSGLKIGATLLGHPCTLPLVISPTGLAGLLWPGGDIALARAAAEFGIPYCLSTMSVSSMEEVADAVPPASRWFQLYIVTDRALTDSLIDRAAASGYETLCLSLDQPGHGTRWRDMRNGWGVPLDMGPRNLLDFALHPRWSLRALANPIRFGNLDTGHRTGLQSARRATTTFDRSVTWDDVARVRRLWRGRLVIKGLLSADDAAQAQALGADAVVISNHGGRQLDDVPAPLDALLPIAERLRGKIELIVDGGVRTGSDIIKACALGATACMAGRPTLWGLAADGESGVADVLHALRSETDTAMCLLGALDIAALDVRLLQRRAP